MPPDLNAIERSLNEASGRVLAVWLSWLTFALYLAIATGSVTHEMLLLEKPIRLPVLNVDLPIVAFFAVAPVLFIIFQFYLFLQLTSLLQKIEAYNDSLRSAVLDSAGRQLIRQRLDSFFFVQLLAGPDREQHGFRSFLFRFVAWMTIAAIPVSLLLLVQVTFLPYHLEWVVWLHRAVILVDLLFVWSIWFVILTHDWSFVRGLGQRHRSLVSKLGGLLAALIFPLVTLILSPLVAAFSVFVATYPGEWIDKSRVGRMIDAHCFPIRVANQALPLSEALFRGPVNEVVGKPRSVFSNVLVVPDANFEEDLSPRRAKRRFSLRGRDLRGAFLARSDFHQVDFSGANLSGSRLDGARLDGAVFGCAQTGLTINAEGRPVPSEPRSLVSWPRDGCTWLVGASLEGASLLGARLDRVKLQGASLRSAQLAGATLIRADLSAANLDFASLQGASLEGTILLGASMRYAQLQGAHLGGGTSFLSLFLNRAADLKGASLDNAYLWRTRGGGRVDGRVSSIFLTVGQPSSVRFRPSDLVSLSGLNFSPEAHYVTSRLRQLVPGKPAPADAEQKRKAFVDWVDNVLKPISDLEIRTQVKEKLTVLDPELQSISDEIDQKDWTEARDKLPKGLEYQRAMKELFVQMACNKVENSPYLMRGLIRNERIATIGKELAEFAALIRNNKCAGAKGLTTADLEDLENLVQRQR